ncbi:hypothetical protein L873DRAFT_913840 [Choiromyces venosus 120613-1]|uniref:Uncharacterized protein n=1 Tax=Choiromyces venosus 120613-1 TaxID=1336337 RepID=A0A3N4IR70_9PEZI|nr:hypothetical protein L873DRAFT_913840 [Choiromyces venosus 120613-1]
MCVALFSFPYLGVVRMVTTPLVLCGNSFLVAPFFFFFHSCFPSIYLLLLVFSPVLFCLFPILFFGSLLFNCVLFSVSNYINSLGQSLSQVGLILISFLFPLPFFLFSPPLSSSFLILLFFS